MKPTKLFPAIRPGTSNLLGANTICPVVWNRRYASKATGLGTTGQPSGPRRRTITAFNDDGNVPWSELTAGEKASRATQQTYNFGMIIVGLVLTSGVAYFLWTDVFSPDSKTAQFNRIVNRLKKDQRCLYLFGDANKIICHGEETFNKWRRARPLAATEKIDPQGNHHLMMHFHVDGPKNKGTAQVHMIMRRGGAEYEYKYFFVDVKGQERVYLENNENAAAGGGKKKLSLFGVNWG